MGDNSESVKKWRANLKTRCLGLFGNKCYICGYDGCKAALEFHHLDIEEKEFHLSKAYRNPKSWESIVKELKKCILVCANCHREIHYGITEVDTNKNYLLEEFIDYRNFEGTSKSLCEECGEKEVSSSNHNFCSQECFRKSRRIRDWDLDLEDIVKLKESGTTFTEIAKLYNTSDKTIAKWYYRTKSI